MALGAKGLAPSDAAPCRIGRYGEWPVGPSERLRVSGAPREPSGRRPMKKPKSQPGLPSRDQILRFIEDSPSAVGKREIANHFALRGADKIAPKALLRDLTDEGLVAMDPGGAFLKHGGLPRLTLLRDPAGRGQA